MSCRSVAPCGERPTIYRIAEFVSRGNPRDSWRSVARVPRRQYFSRAATSCGWICTGSVYLPRRGLRGYTSRGNCLATRIIGVRPNRESRACEYSRRERNRLEAGNRKESEATAAATEIRATRELEATSTPLVADARWGVSINLNFAIERTREAARLTTLFYIL